MRQTLECLKHPFNLRIQSDLQIIPCHPGHGHVQHPLYITLKHHQTSTWSLSLALADAVLRCLSRGVYSSARGGTGIGARSIPALLEVAATYDELGRDGDLVYDPGLCLTWVGLWPEDSVGLATA